MKDPEGDAALAEWFASLESWDAARDDAPAGPIRTIAYGDHPDQVLDIWSASAGRGPVVVSLHGGYFMPDYDRSLHNPVSRQLASDGFVVCNVEYRRGSAGLASTVSDVCAAVDAVAGRFRGRMLAVFGHSAGGYLCELVAQHPAVELVVPLAPVSDLAEASRAGWDDGGIAQWMGAGPDAATEAYRRADLRTQISGAAKRIVVHGTADTAVGIEQSRSYTRALRAAGIDVEYVELADEGHYGYLDPREPAFDVLQTRLRRWRNESRST